MPAKCQNTTKTKKAETHIYAQLPVAVFQSNFNNNNEQAE